MDRNRCPWCGKKINRYLDGKDVKQKKLPKYFRFARCSHCWHYYGQHAYSDKRMKYCFLFFFFSLIPIFLFQIAPLMFLWLIIPFVGFSVPLSRLDENEDPAVTEDDPKIEITLLETPVGMRLHKLYFLTDRFDDCDAFSTVAPIYVYASDKKENKMSGCFLYEHSQNAEYMEKELVNVYDSDKNIVAKSKLHPQPKEDIS